MAICPHINLSKPAKFKREHGIYLVLSTPKCTHSPENQHTGNNPEVMGGISTVDVGCWDEIQSPAMGGERRKGGDVEELRGVGPPTAGDCMPDGGGVREIIFVWVQQGAPHPIPSSKKLDIPLKGKKKKETFLPLLFCFVLLRDAALSGNRFSVRPWCFQVS